MSLKSSFELLADYNQWMNRNLYEATSKLGPEAIAENRGAFFASILGTLNHILVADTIWLKRFADHPSNLVALDYVRSLEKPKALNEILYDDFTTLRQVRERMDETIIDFAREITENHLDTPLVSTTMKGETFSRNLGFTILHFFNHQTHHRGQVTTLLSQAGIDMGPTDLLLRVPNE